MSSEAPSISGIQSREVAEAELSQAIQTELNHLRQTVFTSTMAENALFQGENAWYKIKGGEIVFAEGKDDFAKGGWAQDPNTGNLPEGMKLDENGNLIFVESTTPTEPIPEEITPQARSIVPNSHLPPDLRIVRPTNVQDSVQNRAESNPVQPTETTLHSNFTLTPDLSQFGAIIKERIEELPGFILPIPSGVDQEMAESILSGSVPVEISILGAEYLRALKGEISDLELQVALETFSRTFNVQVGDLRRILMEESQEYTQVSTQKLNNEAVSDPIVLLPHPSEGVSNNVNFWGSVKLPTDIGWEGEKAILGPGFNQYCDSVISKVLKHPEFRVKQNGRVYRADKITSTYREQVFLFLRQTCIDYAAYQKGLIERTEMLESLKNSAGKYGIAVGDLEEILFKEASSLMSDTEIELETEKTQNHFDFWGNVEIPGNLKIHGVQTHQTQIDVPNGEARVFTRLEIKATTDIGFNMFSSAVVNRLINSPNFKIINGREEPHFQIAQKRGARLFLKKICLRYAAYQQNRITQEQMNRSLEFDSFKYGVPIEEIQRVVVEEATRFRTDRF